MTLYELIMVITIVTFSLMYACNVGCGSGLPPELENISKDNVIEIKNKRHSENIELQEERFREYVMQYTRRIGNMQSNLDDIKRKLDNLEK